MRLRLVERCSLWLYGALMRLLQPLLLRKLRRRGQQEPGYLHQVPQRLGRYDTPAVLPGAVWVHAVSLGETRAAGLLIDALRQRWPDMRLVLTHSTATGWAQGQSLLRPGDVQVWFPWDTPRATRQFLQQHQPVFGVLLETEVWPFMVQACQQARVPLFLVNARLNDKSWRSARRWSWLSGPAYRGLQAVWAQSEADAQRLRSLGARVEGVLGNLKFDVQDQPQARALAQSWRARWRLGDRARPVVMLASTREGEEAEWLDALAAQPEREQAFRDAGVLWLLVPRHPQRFDEVHASLQSRGMAVFRRSALPPGDGDGAWPVAAVQASVFLGDSVGEMPVYFQAADMALLGGSFKPLGGQNLIEAAAFGCPIIMGPHTYNFADAAQGAEASGAARRVANMDAALDQVLVWLKHPADLDQAQHLGLQLVAQSRGAAQRCAQSIMAEGAVSSPALGGSPTD
ncbi:3-deoxy-D-manno-octulosonic acid transferase [Limnohabitans sp.]|uniref:3-deoxy-D-manno-octulosonic acid transferase n=2 Tax=Limnohabitans sp. TaxID=1907725 RepID=UPI00391AB7F9